MDSKCKILLVDDHQIILDSLALLLNTMSSVLLVGSITDGRQVLNFLANNEVDLIICDFHIPFVNGLELTLQVRRQHPRIKVLLLTMSEEAHHIRQAIKLGVSGYILKKSGRQELEKAIDTIMSGKKYFSQAVIEELAADDDEDYNNHHPSTIQHLTEREIEVLRLISLEYSSNEIAKKLFISLSTVETHRRNLFQKVNVKNVIGLVKFAIQNGLVD